MTLATVHPFVTAAAVVAAVFFFARWLAERRYSRALQRYKADRIYHYEVKIREQKDRILLLERVQAAQHHIDAEKGYYRDLQRQLEATQQIPA
jgi:hypothetical protein